MPTKPAWPIENCPARPLMMLSERATITLTIAKRASCRQAASGMIRSKPNSRPTMRPSTIRAASACLLMRLSVGDIGGTLREKPLHPQLLDHPKVGGELPLGLLPGA